jgi:hypothetical protein
MDNIKNHNNIIQVVMSVAYEAYNTNLLYIIAPYIILTLKDININEIGYYLVLLNVLYTVSQLIGYIVWFKIGSYLGIKNSLVVGLFLNMLVYLVLMFCNNFWLLATFRFLIGISNMNVPISKKYISDSISNETKDLLMKQMLASWKIGLFVASALCSFLYNVQVIPNTNYPLMAISMVSIIITAIMVILIKCIKSTHIAFSDNDLHCESGVSIEMKYDNEPVVSTSSKRLRHLQRLEIEMEKEMNEASIKADWKLYITNIAKNAENVLLIIAYIMQNSIMNSWFALTILMLSMPQKQYGYEYDNQKIGIIVTSSIALSFLIGLGGKLILLLPPKLVFTVTQIATIGIIILSSFVSSIENHILKIMMLVLSFTSLLFLTTINNQILLLQFNKIKESNVSSVIFSFTTNLYQVFDALLTTSFISLSSKLITDRQEGFFNYKISYYIMCVLLLFTIIPIMKMTFG